MKPCKPELIIQENHFCIARCKHCQRIGLSYKNVLAGFSPKDFVAFGQALLKTEFSNQCICYPDGQQYIIVHTCHPDIQFSFDRKEFRELQKGLAEAILLLQARYLVSDALR